MSLNLAGRGASLILNLHCLVMAKCVDPGADMTEKIIDWDVKPPKPDITCRVNVLKPAVV